MSKIRVPFQLPTILLGCWVCLLAGCTDQTTDQPKKVDAGDLKSNTVVAISYPLEFLTRRIAGASINVVLPYPAEIKDPQNWRPSPEAIGQMQSADLIFTNGTGATYANWITTTSLPESKIRNTASKGLALSDYIAVDDVTIVHSHGPEGEHSHSTMVARSWLDPMVAKKQATYIAAELAEVYPDQASEFKTNLKSLGDELDLIAEKIKGVQVKQPNALISATPKLKFLTRSLGSGEQHLTWFETPSPDQAESDLKRFLPSDGPKPKLILFDNVLPSDEIMMIVKQNGIKALAIDLLDQKPMAGDFLTALRDNIETIADALN